MRRTVATPDSAGLGLNVTGLVVVLKVPPWLPRQRRSAPG